MLDRALLNAEIANGPYKKDPEVVAKEIHYEPVPCEVRAVVIAGRIAATRPGWWPNAA